MLAFALFLSALTLAVVWLNVDLWVRHVPGRSNAVLLGIDSGPSSRSRSDGLDPLRAVALVGLLGLIGVTFHVWQDKVFNYSAERVDEIAQALADELDQRDPTDTSSIDPLDIEDALPDGVNADKLLILEAAPDDRSTFWQISDDDGGSPRCLQVVPPAYDDDDPEWAAIVIADVC